jgi:hypothetical protein
MAAAQPALALTKKNFNITLINPQLTSGTLFVYGKADSHIRRTLIQ